MSSQAKLAAGISAPDFHAQLIDGTSLALSSLRGKVVHLAFHRYASCPICNYSLRQFEQRYHELLQRGIVFLPVFHSPAEKIRAFYPALPPFPIIADPARTLYRQYGLAPSIFTMLHPRTMKDMVKLFASQMSRSSRARGLKPVDRSVAVRVAESRSSRARGLKHQRL